MATQEFTTLPPNFGGPHVVLLGAGASRAACPNGDKHGRTLPLMNDLINVVGLTAVLQKHLMAREQTDFEALCSSLAEKSEHDELLYEVDDRVFRYFRALELPDNPTIYDHMVASLRPKDVIATFNWDPLLPQAIHRVAKR